MRSCLTSVFLFAASCTLAHADAPLKFGADAVMALQLPDVRIDSAKHDPEGFVEVDGVIGGTIGFEVLLPDDWNGRFAMGGGGGFVGAVMGASRHDAKNGYATAGTDTGHEASGTVASWAQDDLLAQVNFGHLAVHRTAEVAKALMRGYYGKGPEYSYFQGCSRGGGQAMMEAQRYPDDFDGIVAGAPAFNWNGIAAYFVRIAQVMYPDPAKMEESVVPQSLLEPIYNELMRQCDVADGLEDSIIMDPRAVKFDVSKVPGIMPGQIKAVETVYEGVKNQDGLIFPGISYGSEKEGWHSWLTGPRPELLKAEGAPTATYAFGTQVFKHFVFNDPNWNYANYDFSTWKKDTHLAGTNLNATNPDLSGLKKSGGKLILWHGWSDDALPAEATIDYFEQVKALDPAADEYVRLYMVPGCRHCGAGPGPSRVPWIEVISAWVERGEAPDRIVATATEEDGVVKERPLYPWPQQAVYKGSGDAFDAGSFEAKGP